MNVGLIDVGCHDEGVFALRPTHGGFIAHLIGFFRCDLTGLEGLADLICDYIMGLLSASDVLILPLGQQKFLVSGFGITFVGADELTVICLFCVLGVVRAVGKTLSYGLAFVDMQGNQSCCRQVLHRPFKKKSHPKVAFLARIGFQE